MRVLHTIRSVDTRGGGVIYAILSLAQAYAQRNRSIEIVSLDFPDDDWVRTCPVKVHALGTVPGKYGYSPEFVRWLRRESRHFDAVVVNGLWQFNSFGAWLALRESGLPYYVFPHGMLDPWFKKYYPLKHLKKWLYWPWGDYRVLRDASAVLYTSEEERRQASQSFWLYHCREEVVPFGLVPPPEGSQRQVSAFLQCFPELRGRRLWLFLGRLHEKKGCDLLLQGFAKAALSQPDIHLVMAGPGPDGSLARYQGMAASLGLNARVTWTGMLSGDERWGAFRAAEVFILPSHQENFGLAVAEALACGTPVLISNKVNIWREVVSSRAGLAADDDQEGLDLLLQSWRNLSGAERAAMRLSASNCFKEKFYIDGFINRMEVIFERGAAEARRGRSASA